MASSNSASSYNAYFYDVAIPDAVFDDIQWYRRLAREAGGPVLELGAGTGRITIPIAQEGVEICALDADAGMLDALRRKVSALSADEQSRITPIEGDMRTFALDRRFPLVICPFRAFLHNLTADDQLACLRRAHAHLQPGGAFAFNVFHPSLEYMARHTGALAGVWRWTATHALPDGGTILRSEASRYDTVNRRVYSLHRYDQFDAAGMLTRTHLHQLELAFVYASDLRYLLQAAGFGRIEIFGDFHGAPFQHDTDELVIVARRD